MDQIRQFLAHVPTPVQWALAGVGALYVSGKVLSFLSIVLNLFVLGGTNLRKYGPKGTWAVVTGASDGLGKEYAQQLAAKGFNLVLVSRTESKLKTLARELELRWSGFQYRIVSIDYANATDADFNRLAETIADLDVGILINNVGQSHSIPVSFLDTTQEEMNNIITINCLGTLKTTKVVAPKMTQRKKGLILTMGSHGGWSPTPFLATYSGSKAFLQQWSTALASELKPSGVDVYLVLSYLVVSAMSKVRRPSLMIPNAKPFVKSALANIGCVSGNFASTYTPYWTHALFQWTIENTLGVGHWLVVKINKDNHIDIRRRALRKAEREAKKA